MIVDPQWGEVIAGPLYGEEGMLVADCDLRRGLHAKRWFDAVGHYEVPYFTAPHRRSAEGGPGRRGGLAAPAS